MKTHKRKLPVLILLAIFCFTLLHMTACKDKKQPDNPDPPDVIQTDYGIDNVYYAKDDGREYLFTISGNSFLISGFNGEQTGKFVDTHVQNGGRHTGVRCPGERCAEADL